jgi:hypothetical protein
VFRVSGFRIRVSDPGFWISDLEFPDPGFRLLGFGLEVSVVGFSIVRFLLGFGVLSSVVVFFGSWVLDLQIVVFEVDLDQLIQLHDVCSRVEGVENYVQEFRLKS